MKKFFAIFFGVATVGVFIWTAVFLYQKSQQKPVVYETQQPFVTDIVVKTVATGKIIPRKEVEVKSQVSGVVETIYVEAGQPIAKDALIAKIQIIPNMERLVAAESRVETARLRLDNAKTELARQKSLFADQLIPEFEFNKYQYDFNLQKEELDAAENALAIVREGASQKAGKISNQVKATLQGLILDIPVKEGTFVTETNTFNAGTTIATIANMEDMIFEGTVDESEVGKISEGMDLLLNIGAMEKEPFVAKLEYISPQGVDDQGTIKFEIRAAVTLRKNHFLRAGYSATADIVLDRADQVLAINERLLLVEEGKTYVEVETAPQEFVRREVATGLSDGINIEIVSGIDKDARLKVR
ncbi:efflux RND transporter periplasmic adaptor subunit [Teredinibacter turnerae]|uniref:efflux RND transporter periplasmic adaptor subunit n=1 Tax=Teredinibacter turnerae TaxID=2426 RepID=UPI000372FE78|nr:efflux RND transporter periplasmic adaptor subunit [Teredinibacter turnerae]